MLDQSDISLYLAKYHSNAITYHAVLLLSLLFSDIAFYHSNNKIQRLMLSYPTQRKFPIYNA